MKLERVAKNLFVGTGLILGLGLAMTPLTTYAAIVTENNTNADGTTSHTCYEDRPSIDAEGNQAIPTVSCSYEVSDGAGGMRGMEVAFKVQPTITIDALAAPGVEGSGGPIVLSPTVIREGQITASITANTQYSLALSADHGMTSMQHETNENGLIPASSNLVGGTPGWGIKTSGDTEGVGTYAAITNTPVTYFTSETTAPISKSHSFTVGIAASPNLPSGIYQATVVVTATAKN